MKKPEQVVLPPNSNGPSYGDPSSVTAQRSIAIQGLPQSGHGIENMWRESDRVIPREQNRKP